MPPNHKAAIYQGVEELSAADCLDIARRKLNLTDVEVTKVTMTTLSDTPCGFLGDHYKVMITVRYRKLSGDQKSKAAETVELPFFVKTMPRNTLQTTLMDSLGAFRKELEFFRVLVGLYRKYDVEVGRIWGPECYFTGPKVIVLNDLTEKGFRILDNRSVMDYEHCVVLVRTLAKFHASSLVYEEKESEKLGRAFRLNEAHPELFKETFWTKEVGNYGEAIVKGGIKSVASLAKMMPNLRRGSPELYETVKEYLGGLFDDVCEMVLPSTQFRNVVTHGDLWANNILFRYSGQEAQDARLVDFQLLRYTAPAHDLLTALHLNTTRDTRDKRWLQLAGEYHEALSAELGKHRIDVERVLPWKQFEASLEHYRLLAVLMTCLYFPTTLMPGHVAAAIFSDVEKTRKFMLEDRSEAACLCFETDAVYRERISQAVEEMAERLADRKI